jgi:hypothetical protein
METLLRYAPLITSIIILVAVPLVLYYGRQFFAEKDDTISPLAFEKRMTDGFEKVKLGVVNEINTTLTATNGVTMMRLEGVGKEIAALRDDIKEAARIGREATDEATKALHATELLQVELKSYRELMDERLKGVFLERRSIPRGEGS